MKSTMCCADMKPKSPEETKHNIFLKAQDNQIRSLWRLDLQEVHCSNAALHLVLCRNPVLEGRKEQNIQGVFFYILEVSSASRVTG